MKDTKPLEIEVNPSVIEDLSLLVTLAEPQILDSDETKKQLDAIESVKQLIQYIRELKEDRECDFYPV